MSKLSEFVEKNRHNKEPWALADERDLQALFRDLFDEIEKHKRNVTTLKYGYVTVADIRNVFVRFTGSDYTQERKG